MPQLRFPKSDWKARAARYRARGLTVIEIARKVRKDKRTIYRCLSELKGMEDSREDGRSVA